MIQPRTLETPEAGTWRRAEVAPPWDYDIENLRAGLQVRFGRALLLVSFDTGFSILPYCQKARIPLLSGLMLCPCTAIVDLRT